MHVCNCVGERKRWKRASLAVAEFVGVWVYVLVCIYVCVCVCVYVSVCSYVCFSCVSLSSYQNDADGIND